MTDLRQALHDALMEHTPANVGEHRVARIVADVLKAVNGDAPSFVLPSDEGAPLGERYQGLLTDVWRRVSAIALEHDEHGEANGSWCGRESGTCDELGERFSAVVDAVLNPSDAGSWLADGPADLLDWYAELGGQTPREVVMNALSHDVDQRVFGSDGWPRRG